MNINKICFITCVRDERVYKESLLYINQLDVPVGVEVQIIESKNAPSMTQGYNSGMNASDAKYKVYLHEDVFIVNKNFIHDVIAVFKSNQEIGLMGVVGCKDLPANAIWWESTELYGTVYENHTGQMARLQFKEAHEDYVPVQCVDGLILITQYDVPWREELFTDEYFYDISQSIEFSRGGYKVVVPRQEQPWCIHDTGSANQSKDYDHYRRIFIAEYAAELFPVVPHLLPTPHLINNQECSNELRQWLVNDEDVTIAKKLIMNSQQILNNHVIQAKQAMFAGEWEKAADIVQTTGQIAHNHHPGMFFDPELENILKCCAEQLDTICSQCITNEDQKVENKRHVLHVFSEGYQTGGHTRLAARWMQQDCEAIHSVISLWTGAVMPQWIVEAAQCSGGWYINMGSKNLTLFSKAKELREIAHSWADVVVLHTHMWDVIPSIAFGIDGGPPVVLLNHGDHVFWFGTAVADMIADIRPAGHDVTRKRRGTRRSMLINIPLVESNGQYTRKDARERLGMDEQTVLLLSIASPYKYISCGNYNFPQMLDKIVQKHSHVVALIIGPGDDGMWQQLRIQTNERIRALGAQYDLDIFHSAADIYLDSFSIASLTATLEAGLRGLPVVRLESQIASPLRNDDLSFVRTEDLLFTEDVTYEQKIETLINDAALRNQLGSNLSQNIKADHIDNWNKRLQEIYHCLPNTHTVLRSYEEVAPWSEGDMIWAYLQYKMGWCYLYKGGLTI